MISQSGGHAPFFDNAIQISWRTKYYPKYDLLEQSVSAYKTKIGILAGLEAEPHVVVW